MADYPIALRKVSEDGRYRLTVRYDECAMHPLNNCDFPLHMDDWSRDYSANPTRRSKDCDHYESREGAMRDLLCSYGDREKIISELVRMGKSTNGNENYGLTYDRSGRRWVLQEWFRPYQEDWRWIDLEYFDGRRDDIDLYSLLYHLNEYVLADLLNTCLTDELKVMSYSFGYQGSIVFDNCVCADSEGLAWLVKSEATRCWLSEKQWREQSIYDLTEGERTEIKAWAKGEVFYFEVEKAVKWRTHRECLSEEREPQDFEETEWEYVDSCGGFYSLGSCECYAIENWRLPKMLEAA